VLPGDYTFTEEDAGIKTFSITFNTPGSQTLTAAEPGAGGLIGYWKIDEGVGIKSATPPQTATTAAFTTLPSGVRMFRPASSLQTHTHCGLTDTMTLEGCPPASALPTNPSA
jgi:hypothetical protein